MSNAQITFLGAGKANVVVDLPLADIPHAPASLHATATTQRAALRIRSAAHKECPECYRALQVYAGSRHIVPLENALYNAIEAVVPPKHRQLIRGAAEATIVPNFTSDPAQLLQLDLAAGDEAGRVADYTVEVKPKSAWQPPQVVGIVVDGVAYRITPTKLHHCRYAQMLSYKEVRDAKEEAEPAAVASAPPTDVDPSYCPNFLFCPALSSREGLRRLLRSPQNNLKLISYHPSRAQSRSGDPTTLTAEEVHGIADVVDASGVLAPLAHLQLCGCAPPAKDASADVAAAQRLLVLDVELLYRWSLAKDRQAVEWIVQPTDPAALCSCITPATSAVASGTERGGGSSQRVPPLLDFETCVERFYVSTTAKDISLMIAVSSRRGEPDASSTCSRLSGVSAEVGGVFVQRGVDVYRVGVVDLDDKKHKSLEHYYHHDKDIVDAFVKGGRH